MSKCAISLMLYCYGGDITGGEKLLKFILNKFSSIMECWSFSLATI